ncbi:multicopper oxidase domain-containing protein [Nocardioides sp. GCM10027113]|uniref:multicopper oxidase domain-containing protein n=1 Tax=unclassified Nocardioides TaxID=2615069 RepID=UPI00361AD40F
MRTHSWQRPSRITLTAAVALAAAGLGLVATPAHAAAVGFDLWAVTGSATMPGGQAVTVWSYRDSNGPAGAPGGPTLRVAAGDDVTITLHNEVGAPTGLLVQGQEMVPDLTGIADGTQAVYTFTAGEPGTYLYEAAPIPGAEYQPALGLYGALVVEPASPAYDDDHVLLLGEIDPALSNAADPGAFDMRKFAPRYFTINGAAYPDTAPIAAPAGTTQLLRYVNAGMNHHSMAVLGARQTVVAVDGAAYRDPRSYVAETIGPGQTLDALVTVPDAASVDVDLTVYDAGLGLHNSNTGGVGGMLTTLEVPGVASPGDATGPVTSGATAAAGTLTATVDDGQGHGGSDVQAAEYFLDAPGGAGTGTAMDAQDGAFDSATEAVTADVTVPSGDHVLYLRGQDAAGNWGPLTSVLVTGADTGGPTVKSPSLTPNLVNGANSLAVAVSATADDTASGNSAIAAAEYFIDTVGADGSGDAMNVSPAGASIASIDGTIPPGTLDGLTEGTHVVYLHAQDADGNWGDALSATVNLTVDETAPNVSGVSVEPTPNNGTLPYSSSVPAVRVIATTMTDPVSGGVNSPVTKAEAFIDTVGANGSGIPLASSDGVFNDTTEGGYADIPLATVVSLANGSHTISVHARDAAGNWGTMATTTLVVDKTRPTISGLAASPNPTLGAATVTLTGTATDPSGPSATSTGITRAEWWIGADPGVGNGTPMTVTGTGPVYDLSATVDVSGLGDGDHQLRARAKDGAGNWSTVATTTLQVRVPLIFSTAGNANPPGIAGAADNADLYRWSGTAYSRVLDLSAAPYNVPLSANVDGFNQVDATHFEVSFAANTNLPGLGVVQDEDVVLWDAGSWTVWFDGTAHGLTAAGQDIDAFSVVAGTLYFSTLGNVNPPGVGGAADNADIYSWSGAAFSRVWDATANGVPAAANVDGYDRVDATHFYLSFADNTTVAGVGAVQDEDVVFINGATRTVAFDGTAHGLTTAALDVDAFDVQ